MLQALERQVNSYFKRGVMSFDEDPMDLLEDDGDGVVEMGIFFDEDKESGSNQSPQGKSGCSIILLLTGGTMTTIGYGVSKLLT